MNGVLSTPVPGSGFSPMESFPRSGEAEARASQANILERIGRIVRSVERKRGEWSDCALGGIGQVDLKLASFPALRIQDKIDDLGRRIESLFAPLKEFNDWLHSNGLGAWYKQLAIFLVTLPLRAIRNILQLLYQVVKGCCCFAVHPLESVSQLARLIVRLLVELTKPETWSKIGAGCLGASFGQSLVIGNPLSLVGIGIGTACLLGGVSIGALRAALLAEEGNRAQAAWANVTNQLKQLPETALTGFFMGMMIGAVQKAIQHHRMKDWQQKAKDWQRETEGWKITTYEEAKRYVEEFIQQHNLPAYSSIAFEKGTIIITWSNRFWGDFFRFFPGITKHCDLSIGFLPESLVVKISSSGSQCIVEGVGWVHGADRPDIFSFMIPCEEAVPGLAYPLLPPPPLSLQSPS